MIKKRLCAAVLLCLLLVLCAVQVFAADSSRQFLFELSADGKTEKQVSTGDIVTVSFTLRRTDSAEDYTMYGMQDEILYDGSFFELDESSIMTANGLNATDLSLRDGSHALYINFVSMTGGDTWKADTMAGTFRLKVIGTSGSSVVRSSSYLVSTKDGQDSYEATAQDVTFVISSDCTVHFETNGGSDVPDQSVSYGGKVKRPADPVREGYHLEGWYRDLDRQVPWDFSRDTVTGNMTLYAGWAEGEPEASGGVPVVRIVLAAVLVLALLLVLLMLGRTNTVRFETNGGSAVPSRRVRKGGKLSSMTVPQKDGSVFDGWYRDQACTRRWNAETDTVNRNMTLYARWK